MTTNPESEFRSEFSSRTTNLQRLRTTAYGIVENGLKSEAIDHLPIQSRVKTLESAWQKSQAKQYDNPFSEMTDLVGVRIIVFLESDINRARKIIETLFEIDEKNSVDKRIPERNDTVGYRSLHLICSLGGARASLPEYGGIGTQKFEIQIRTALQHTWAEIEHKRNYKGADALPDDLQHRLMVLAGTIELLDREFSQIAYEASEYERGLISRATPSTASESLSKLAIDAVFRREFQRYSLVPPSLSAADGRTDMISELNDFGVKTVDQFEELITQVDFETIARHYNRDPDSHSVGLIRDLMIVSDAEKYFRDAHNNRWQGTSYEDVEFLNRASGRTDLENLFREYDIDLYAEEVEEY